MVASFVAHRALDGGTYHLQGDLDLQLPCTSAVEMVVGGRLVEFTAGPASLGDDVAASLGIGSPDSDAPSRRTVLQTATAAGFAALGVFSAARQAYADGYDIWTGACPSYAADHNCSPGCA